MTDGLLGVRTVFEVPAELQLQADPDFRSPKHQDPTPMNTDRRQARGSVADEDLWEC